MKKIGNKVLLMIAVFVVIFGINTAVSVRTQKSVKLAGAATGKDKGIGGISRAKI